MYTIINIVCGILIAILGAMLGGEYKNPLHLSALGALIAYMVIVQHLISKNNSLNSEKNTKENELAIAKSQLSELLFQSNQYGENRMYLAVHPVCTGRMLCSRPITVQIIMNAPFGITHPPDFKLLTSESWGSIKVLGGSPVLPRPYGAEWEYTFSTTSFSNLQNISNKFFLAQIVVNFRSSGTYVYKIEAKSADFQSSISNSFEIA